MKRKCEDNTKGDLGEVGCEDRRWMELTQEHVQYKLWFSRIEPVGSATIELVYIVHVHCQLTDIVW